MLHMHPGQHHFPPFLLRDNPLGSKPGAIRPGTINEQVGDDQDEKGRKSDRLFSVEKKEDRDRDQNCQIVDHKVFQGRQLLSRKLQNFYTKIPSRIENNDQVNMPF